MRPPLRGAFRRCDLLRECGVMYKNCAAVLGAFVPDEAALREIADDALALTSPSGDNFGLATAR